MDVILLSLVNVETKMEGPLKLNGQEIKRSRTLDISINNS